MSWSYRFENNTALGEPVVVVTDGTTTERLSFDELASRYIRLARDLREVVGQCAVVMDRWQAAEQKVLAISAIVNRGDA